MKECKVKIKFLQCTMERKQPKGKAVLTSWIPEKFAKKDRVLELKDRDTDEWTDGWVVKHVSRYHRNKDEAIERSQDYTKTRKASDI